jgi:hypothetical protein
MAMQLVKIVDSRLEAEMLCSLLENEGIRAVVQSEDMGGLRPDLAFSSGGARILVDQSFLSRAKEILNAIETDRCSS